MRFTKLQKKGVAISIQMKIKTPFISASVTRLL